MRDLQSFDVYDRVAVIQNVEVDAARTFRHQAPPSHVAFDPQQASHQLPGQTFGFRLHHLIQEPRLIGDVARRGFKETRFARDRNFHFLHAPPRFRQVGGAIAEIGPESDVDGFQATLTRKNRARGCQHAAERSEFAQYLLRRGIVQTADRIGHQFHALSGLQ